MLMRPPVALATTALTVLLVAGCSSSGGSANTGSTGAGSTGAGSTGTGSTSSTAPSTGTSASGGGTADAATTAAITKAYGTFFSSTADVPASEAALQHGAKFLATLKAEANSAYANKASVTIKSVTLAGTDAADVKFVLKTSGLTLPIDGKAAREGGTWKVAAVTFCGLLQAEGHAPAVCSDPAVVGLPS